MLLCYVYGLDILFYVFWFFYECKMFRKLIKWSGVVFGGFVYYGGVVVFLFIFFFRNWDILWRCRLIFIYFKFLEEIIEVDFYVVLLFGFGKFLFNLNFVFFDSYFLGSFIVVYMKSVNDIMLMIGVRFYI